MNTADELSLAIERYKYELSSFIPGQDGYLKIEVHKVQIANILLESIGVPIDKEFWSEEKSVVAMSGFVYLMKNQRNGFLKIGWSINPKFREKTLQSEEPEIDLLHKWRASKAAESLLHLRFRNKRIRGEWFRLDAADIEFVNGFFGKESSHE